MDENNMKKKEKTSYAKNFELSNDIAIIFILLLFIKLCLNLGEKGAIFCSMFLGLHFFLETIVQIYKKRKIKEMINFEEYTILFISIILSVFSGYCCFRYKENNRINLIATYTMFISILYYIICQIKIIANKYDKDSIISGIKINKK